jgi:hypothetical protein
MSGELWAWKATYDPVIRSVRFVLEIIVNCSNALETGVRKVHIYERGQPRKPNSSAATEVRSAIKSCRLQDCVFFL